MKLIERVVKEMEEHFATAQMDARNDNYKRHTNSKGISGTGVELAKDAVYVAMLNVCEELMNAWDSNNGYDSKTGAKHFDALRNMSEQRMKRIVKVWGE